MRLGLCKMWLTPLLTIIAGSASAVNSAVAAAALNSATVKFIRVLPRPDDVTTRFSDPGAIAVDVQGNVFVLDSGNSRVIKFDPAGKVAGSVGGFGWQNEEFDSPADISVKSTLDVFVADWRNQRIERYDKDLNYLASLTADDNSPENLQFVFPIAIDVSRHGELFVCDSENNRIVKFNAFGQPVLSFGDYNSGAGRIQKAGKLEISMEDMVVVADAAAGDIILFDYYGNFVSRIGSDFLEMPVAVATMDRLIFVTDKSQARIVVLGMEGSLKFSWGSRGSGIGAFESPSDVALDDKYVYVLDSGNERIQVFSHPVLDDNVE